MKKQHYFFLLLFLMNFYEKNNSSPVSVADGGTELSSVTAYAVLCGGTTSIAPLQNVSGLGTSGYILTSNGAGALPTWQPNPISTPITVPNGGTGLTTLTSNGVLIGNGTSAITVTAEGSNGQVLLGTTGGDPTWRTPTAGTGLTITTNSTTLDYALTVPMVVTSGGTGVTTMTTAYAVLCAGTSATNPWQTVSGLGSATQVLTSNGSSSLPTWQSVSVPSTPISVGNGGTGLTTLTSNGVLIGNGTSAITVTAEGTNGQVLLGATGADPSWRTPTAGTGLTITTNSTTLDYALTVPMVVTSGGTGITTGTTAYVLLATGTSATGAFQPLASTGASGDWLTSNGSSALPTWGAAPIQTASVTLTNSQCKNLHATPITIVAAPGSGKMINVVSCTITMNYGGTNVFSTGGGGSKILALSYNNTSGQSIIATAMANAGIVASSSQLARTYPANLTSGAYTNVANLPVVIWYNASGSNEIGGNAANDNTMTVSLEYQTLTIP